MTVGPDGRSAGGEGQRREVARGESTTGSGAASRRREAPRPRLAQRCAVGVGVQGSGDRLRPPLRVGQHVLIDLKHGTSMRLVVEPERGFPRGPAHPAESLAVGEQVGDRRRPRLRVLGGQQPAGHPVLHQLRATPDLAHQQRRAHGHALEHDVGERLVPGGQQGEVELLNDLRDVRALAEEVHLVLHAQLGDQRVEALEVGVVVVAHALAGEGDLPDHQQVCVQSRPVEQRHGPDRVVLGLPRGDLRDVAEQCRLGGDAKPLADARGLDPVGVEAGAVEAVVDVGRQGLVEPLVELARHLTRHPEDRAGRVRQHRPHAAAHRGLGHVLVSPDHHRRTAQPPGDGAHEARARRVGVDDVGVEATRGASQRDASRAQAQHVHRGLDRVEAQAGLEARDRDSLHGCQVHHPGQRPARGTGHGHAVPSLQPLDQPHERELRAAGGSGVVYEEDPHWTDNRGQTPGFIPKPVWPSRQILRSSFRRFAMNRPTASSEHRSRHQVSEASVQAAELGRIVQHALERSFQLRPAVQRDHRGAGVEPVVGERLAPRRRSRRAGPRKPGTSRPTLRAGPGRRGRSSGACE